MSTELEKKNWWLTYVDIPSAVFFVGEIAYGVFRKTEGIVRKKIEKDIDKAIAVECRGLGAKNKNQLVAQALKTFKDKTIENSLLSRIQRKDIQWKDAPVILGAAIATYIWAHEDPYDVVGEKGAVGLIVAAKALFGHKMFSYGPPGRGSLNGYLSWLYGSYTEALNETLETAVRLKERPLLPEEKPPPKIPQELAGYRDAPVPEKGNPSFNGYLTKRRTFLARRADLPETLREGEKRRWFPAGRVLVTAETAVPEDGPRRTAYPRVRCLSSDDKIPPSGTGGTGGTPAQSPAYSTEKRMVILPGEENRVVPVSDNEPIIIISSKRTQDFTATNPNPQAIYPEFPITLAEATQKPWYDTYIFNPANSIIDSILRYSGTPVSPAFTGQLSSSPAAVSAPVRSFIRPVFVN